MSCITLLGHDRYPPENTSYWGVKAYCPNRWVKNPLSKRYHFYEQKTYAKLAGTTAFGPYHGPKRRLSFEPMPDLPTEILSEIASYVPFWAVSIEWHAEYKKRMKVTLARCCATRCVYRSEDLSHGYATFYFDAIWLEFRNGNVRLRKILKKYTDHRQLIDRLYSAANRNDELFLRTIKQSQYGEENKFTHRI